MAACMAHSYDTPIFRTLTFNLKQWVNRFINEAILWMGINLFYRGVLLNSTS
jgi:hypothetical protein